MQVDLLLSVPVPGLLERDPPLVPDLGLGYVATAARNAGFSTRVVDWNPHVTADEYREFLREHDPKVVGIKVFTVNLRETIQTLRIIRETLPEAILIIGGPHPSMSDPEYLFEEFRMADFAYRGEAETCFTNFLDVLRSIDFDRYRIHEVTKSFEEIPGLVWREFHRTCFHPQTALANLDEVGLPAWDLIDPTTSLHFIIDEEAAQRSPYVAPLLASRGCPFGCIFCAAHLINGKAVRRRRPDDLLDEIQFLIDTYGIAQYAFTDSSFMLDREHVREVCQGIVDRGFDIRWECIYEVQGNADLEELDSLFGLMYRAGCRRFGFSPESASPKIIETIGKHFDPEHLRRVIALAVKHELEITGFFMAGFPGETMEDLRKTIEFALSEPFEGLFFSILIPLPGSDAYELLKEREGFEHIDWRSYDFAMPPYTLGEVPLTELVQQLYLAQFRHHERRTKGIRKYVSPIAMGWLIRYAYRRMFGWKDHGR